MSPDNIAQNNGVLLYEQDLKCNMWGLPFYCLEIKNFIFVRMILELLYEIFEYLDMSIVTSIMEHGPVVSTFGYLLN
jgi:hypothetical protein